MIVQHVASVGCDQVTVASFQVGKYAAPLDAVTRLQVMLIVPVPRPSGWDNGLMQTESHTILLEESAKAHKPLAVNLTICALKLINSNNLHMFLYFSIISLCLTACSFVGARPMYLQV